MLESSVYGTSWNWVFSIYQYKPDIQGIIRYDTRLDVPSFLLLDGKALERAFKLAIQDLHRAFDLYTSLWAIYFDIPAAMVDTAMVE